MKNFDDRHQTILSVLRGWSKIDPQSAATWIEQLPPGRLRNEAPGAIARALAERDPEAAFAMLKNAKADRNYGSGAYYELFDAWAATDPATAAMRAGEIRNAQQREQAYRNIALRWAEQDVPAALAWAKSLSRDGRQRSSIMAAVLSAWAVNDPGSAANAALALPAGQARDSAIGSLASQWAQKDAAAAGAWAQQLPEGHAKQNVLSSISYQWASQDPQAALAYAQNLPTGRNKNNLISTIAQQMSQQYRMRRWYSLRIFRQARRKIRCSGILFRVQHRPKARRLLS